MMQAEERPVQSLYDTIETVGRDLYLRALKEIPRDVREAIGKGLEAENRDGNRTAQQVLLTILENIKTADERDMLGCQDTGLPIFKILIGTRLRIDVPQVKDRLRKACERATVEYP